MGVPNGYTSAQVVQAVPVITSSGMTLIQAETSTTAATATYSSVFSATYAIYKVFIVVTSANTQALQFRFAAGGTADTASSYTYSLGGTDGTNSYTSASSLATPENKIVLMQNLAGNGQIELTVQNPFQSKVSRLISQAKSYYGGGAQYSLFGGGLFDNTTSFDGFQLLNANGSTFTYATTIYGLAIS